MRSKEIHQLQWRLNEYSKVHIRRKIFFSHFDERFRDGHYTVQFGQFLVCCSIQGSPRDQPFAKVGARAPVPMESAPLSAVVIDY